FKCNYDGASKGNLGPSSGPFSIRNGERNLMYAEVRRLFDGANLVGENILDGIWETPWGIVMEIKRIKMLMEDKEVYSKTNILKFSGIPTKARGIIITEKAKLPRFRIRRNQNGDFSNS
ncbi:hypothetical protein MTR67_026776, partial [Solanum verrucosum]